MIPQQLLPMLMLLWGGDPQLDGVGSSTLTQRLCISAGDESVIDIEAGDEVC